MREGEVDAEGEGGGGGEEGFQFRGLWRGGWGGGIELL